jgi:putative salt-induced outer membrane protein YdiY
MKKILIACLAVAWGLAASAAEEKAAKKDGFETALNVGVSLTEGNSETLLANGSLVTTGERTDLGSVTAGIEANYGEDTKDDVTDTTVNNGKISGNAKKTLSPKTYVYGDASGLYDDVADITYRALAGLGAGAYLIKNDKRDLFVEAGPSYLWEEVADIRDDYLALRFAQGYTCQATKTAKLVETLEYLPRANDFNDYLLNAQVGIEAAMSERVSLRVVLQDKYDSTPAAGAKRNDLGLIAGLGFKL